MLEDVVEVFSIILVLLRLGSLVTGSFVSLDATPVIISNILLVRSCANIYSPLLLGSSSLKWFPWIILNLRCSWTNLWQRR